MEVKQSELKNADVKVILSRDGQVINGTGNVVSGMSSTLGIGVLGRMTLGS